MEALTREEKSNPLKLGSRFSMGGNCQYRNEVTISH